MLEPAEVEAVDSSKLYRDYVAWPECALKALEMEVYPPKADEVDEVVIGGMGGSGIVGDIIHDYLQPKLHTPIHVVKDYHIPKFIDERSLVLAISCSGNTEETISLLHEALKVNAKVAAVSSGGMLEEVCRRKNIPYTKVERLLTPRSSLPCMLYPSIKIVATALKLYSSLEGELEASIRLMREVREVISPNTPIDRNPAKQLAAWLHHHIPVVYASTYHRSAALRFKGSLNENAKVHALIEILPELCHNDIVALGEGGWRLLLLRHPKEPPEVYERFEAIKDVAENVGAEFREFTSQGEALIDHITSTLYTLEFTTLYLAVLRGVDPAPVPPVDRLKVRLKEKLRYVENYCRELFQP